MPLRLQPQAAEVIPIKDVRPEGFEEKGAYEEHFSIAVYLDDKVNADAQQLATTKKVHGNGRVEEDYNHERYVGELIRHQLKGWRIIAPTGADPAQVEQLAPPEGSTPDEVKDYQTIRWWKFTPENVARLPWDVRQFLHGEIIRCGGIIPTRNVLTKTDLGLLLDFRSPNRVIRPGDEHNGADPERDSVREQAAARAGAARNR